MSTNQFIQAVDGDIASAADYDANFLLAQESIADLGPFVITGLVPSAGAGLSVSVSAGTASIGARITASGSFSIAGLADGTLNHLYLKDDGTGTSNTSGTQPADTAKLGTATTSGGVVTSVNILRSSGRQLLVRHENLVPGAVGSPGSLNLASWNATAGDGFSFYGVLPAGALPSSLSGDVTLTPATTARNIIQPTGDTVVPLSLKWHSATMSGNLWQALDNTGALLAHLSANGSLDLVTGNFVTTGTISASGPGTASEHFGAAASVTGDFSLAVGNGATVVGDYACAVGIGALADASLAMVFGPNADAENASIVIGPGAFDTAAAQLVIGSAVLYPSGPPGCFVTDVYIGRGVSDTVPQAVTYHNSDASGANLAAGDLVFAAGRGTGSAKGGDLIFRTAPAGGAGSSNNALSTLYQLTGDRKIAWFNVTPVGQPAQTVDLKQQLINFGLMSSSAGATPLNLNGGLLTAGTISAGATTLTGDLTLSTHNLITDTSTGTQIGTGATQKLGFFGATPVVQISGSTDILAGWVTLGLRAASSNPPLDMGTGLLTGRVLLAAGATGAGTAPLKMQSGSLMTSPEAGACEFLTPGLYATPVSTRRRFILSSDVKTSDTTVANTVVETTVFTGTIAANELAAGMVLRVYYSGDYSTANATDTFTINHKINGVTFISQPSSASSQTQTQWFGRFTATCRTAGGSGSMVSHFEGTYAGNAKNTRDLTVHTVDTTGPLNVTVTVTWSNALSGNTITCRQAYLEML